MAAEWAIKLACERLNERVLAAGSEYLYEPSEGLYTRRAAIDVLAEHIEKHEEPAIDPLLIEARTRVIACCQSTAPWQYYQNRVRDGEEDHNPAVQAVLALLREART